jgi:hypothetical protein
MMLGAVAMATIASAGAMAPAASIEVSPAHVRRGQTVSVHGSAGECRPGDAVTLLSGAFVRAHEFAGVAAVSARVSSTGSFSVRTRIPATRRVGSYVIAGRCGGGNLGVSATLHVLR